MNKSTTEIQEEIDQLITASGLNFLLAIKDEKIISNERSIHLPHLKKKLGPIIATSGLICSFKDTEQAQNTFSKLVEDKILIPGHTPGIRLVAASPIDHVLFKGGSYSTTFAQYDTDHWKVIKQCKAFGHQDKDLRLRAEMESIANLPTGAQKLFPTILDKKITDSTVRFDIEYVPYYNFAEVVRDGNLTTERLSQLLTNMYDQLFELLYVVRDENQPQQELAHYVEIIPERFNEVKGQLSKDNFLHDFIAAETVIIDGTLYPGLQATFQKAKDFLSDKQIPNTHNHGDLILQDVLIDPESGDFRLVDGICLSLRKSFAF